MTRGPIEFIAVDWGTTNVRAYALGGSGEVVDRRTAALGILNVRNREFAAAFDGLVGRWRGGEPVPVLMSGMIGSRQGWVEAAYANCPADPEALAQNLMPVAERENVAIVPGVCLPGTPHRDVMRGEEVQCFGVLDLAGLADATVCLPGTHSKWAELADDRLTRFATSMTGETYAAMRDHSILGALMDGHGGGDAGDAFAAGVARSGDPGGLLNHLFSVRADGLFGVVAADGLADYLSGILIGHEARAMAEMFRPADPVFVVGDRALTKKYAAALAVLGLASRAVDAERATIAGLAAIRRLAAERS